MKNSFKQIFFISEFRRQAQSIVNICRRTLSNDNSAFFDENVLVIFNLIFHFWTGHDTRLQYTRKMQDL